MRRSQFTISAAFVCHCAVGWLVQALQWPVGRAKATPTLLLRLLVRAAAQGRSLSAVVREAAEAPSAEAVRAALRAVLPADPNDLLPATTRALHSRLPKALRRRPRTMAVDWHLRPYYGTKDTPGTLRGQPKASTKTFSLRGIRESPPFLHDGRLLTLEDSVEFFNIVLQTKLERQEKEDLVAFMRTL